MDQSQNELFHENLNAATRSLVAALGGMQKVGHQLRPTKNPLDAGKWLSDALSETHPTQLHPEDLLKLMQLERAAGLKLLATYLMRESGYADPMPVEPEDERAALQRAYIAAAKQMQLLAERIERNNSLRVVQSA